MVTCEPEWEPALARMSMTTGPDDDAGVTTAVGGEMQEQAMLTVQPNLYFGSAADGSGACGGGAFEFVVQDSFIKRSIKLISCHKIRFFNF